MRKGKRGLERYKKKEELKDLGTYKTDGRKVSSKDKESEKSEHEKI